MLWALPFSEQILFNFIHNTSNESPSTSPATNITECRSCELNPDQSIDMSVAYTRFATLQFIDMFLSFSEANEATRLLRSQCDMRAQFYLFVISDTDPYNNSKHSDSKILLQYTLLTSATTPQPTAFRECDRIALISCHMMCNIKHDCYKDDLVRAAAAFLEFRYARLSVYYMMVVCSLRLYGLRHSCVFYCISYAVY